jgi:hypothetical protein
MYAWICNTDSYYRSGRHAARSTGQDHATYIGVETLARCPVVGGPEQLARSTSPTKINSRFTRPIPSGELLPEWLRADEQSREQRVDAPA